MNNLTSALYQSSIDGMDGPHSVEHLLSSHADFLVAREPGKGQRRDGHAVQVERLLRHYHGVCRDAQLLTEVDAVIWRAILWVAALKDKNASGTSANIFSSGCDGVSFIARGNLV